MSAEQPGGDPGPAAADFVESGLATMGIEADEIEMAVIRAAHQLYWPEILELLSIDTGGVPPEPSPDLGQAP